MRGAAELSIESGDATGRIKALDGLRGLAALMVVAYHYLFVQVGVEVGSALWYIRAPLKLAWSGVDLFFVLSGFLITTILIGAKGSQDYFTTFYVRRVFRIFPVYFFMFGCFILASAFLPPTNALIAGSVPWWTYLLFVQNVAMWLQDSFGGVWLAPTWSLAVEEQFYLFVPLIVLWLRPRYAVAALIVLAGLAPVLRLVFPGDMAFVMTPFRTDSLLVGSLLAYAMQSEAFVNLCRARIVVLYGLLSLLLVGIPIMMVRREWFGPFDFTWLSSIYVMLILIVQVSPRGVFARLFSNRILLWFGAMSYAIYMLHDAVLGLSYYLISGYDHASLTGRSDLIVTILAFGITCGLAALSARYFEGPSRRFGQRWTFRKSAPGFIS